MRMLEGLISLLKGEKPKPQEQYIVPTSALKTTPNAAAQSITPSAAEPTPNEAGQTITPSVAPNAEQKGTLTQPQPGTLTTGNLSEANDSLHDAAQKTLVQPENGSNALLTRFANFTSFLEVESSARLRPSSDATKDTPSRRHAERFYVCPRDKKDGLTIGYGTFFTKKGALIKEDEELLDLITFATYKKDKKGNEISVPVNLSKDEKRELVKNLLINMGTRGNVNQDELNKFPYHITAESADKLLHHRFLKKNQELDRLIGNKKRDPLLEWVASDLHYQGMLGSDTLKAMLREGKILKSPKNGKYNGYLPVPKLNKDGDPDLRALARRIVADYYDTIKTKFPFSPNMTEEERKKHADQLHKYVAAHAGEVLGSYGSKHMNLGISQAFIREIASLGSIQIEHDRLGRDLTEKEIQQAKQTAKQNAESYYLAKQSSVKRVQTAQKMSADARTNLAKTTKAAGPTPKVATTTVKTATKTQPNLSKTLGKAGKKLPQGTNTSTNRSGKTAVRT